MKPIKRKNVKGGSNLETTTIDDLIKAATVCHSKNIKEELENEFNGDFFTEKKSNGEHNDTFNTDFPPLMSDSKIVDEPYDIFNIVDDPRLEQLLCSKNKNTPNGDDKLKFFDYLNIEEPNNLVSVTSIINGIECERKANIMEYYGGNFENFNNKYTIIGTLVHRIFQLRLYQHSTSYHSDLHNKLDNEYDIHRLVLEILKTHDLILNMYLADLSENEILDEIKLYYHSIIYWSNVLLGRCKPSTISSSSSSNSFKSFKVCDIEEVISSQRFGIKGNVDVTCLVESNDNSTGSSFILPIELKSSRSYGDNGRLDHRAQLTLYQLVLSETYNKKINVGLLLYLRDEGKAVKVHLIDQEVKHLIGIRNIIANYPKSQYLGEFQSEDICRRCPYTKTCQLLALSNQENLPAHLNSLTLESNAISLDTLKFYDCWRKIIECIHKNELNEVESNLLSNEGSIIMFPYKIQILCCNPLDLGKQYIFKCKIVKSFSFERSKMQTSKIDSALKIFTVGDYVILRSCGDYKNTWKCNIQKMNKNEIILGSFRPLSNQHKKSMFTLEKIPHSTDFKSYNENLLNFVMNNTNQVAHLRDLIVNNKNPTFRKLVQEDINNIESYAKGLNRDQIKALEKCLTANDYALIWGLPGTGKTTTIASLVHIFYKSNQKILVASGTNNSVDNILLKLVERNVNFIRIGPNNRIADKIQKYSFSHFIEGNSLESFKDKISCIHVFATTCSSLSNKIFTKINQFDVCIIDEASQVLLLDLIPALMIAKKFILVGDHKQLPPVIRWNHFCMNEARISLFEKLFNRHHSSVSALTIQYRMPNQLSKICSDIFYHGIMKSSYSNESHLIEWNKRFSGINNLDYNIDKWIPFVLNPQSASVIFVETSHIQQQPPINQSRSEEDMKNICNVEADAIVKILNVLLKFGVNIFDDVAVITQFRKQMELIEQKCLIFNKNIEVHTIDRFQGCEKDVILLSFAVKICSEDSKSSYNHLSNNRLNVAMSRSKKKLVMFGCADLLSSYSTEFAKIISILRNDNCVVAI